MWFNNKYKYKIVLVIRSASWFRGCNFDCVEHNLSVQRGPLDADPWSVRLDPYEQQYTLQLCNSLKKFKDYEIRVENPLISFYTNTESDVEKLAKLDANKVKYVSIPAAGTDAILDEGKVIVTNIDFDIENKNVVAVISGSNSDVFRMPEILDRSLVYEGKKHYSDASLRKKYYEKKRYSLK